ncbi:MAG: GMC family oxidoreductase, partial [Bacteroidota bacterium]
WFGHMITTIVNDFSNLDGEHYGFKIETAPLHPGFKSVVLPYQNAIQFKTDMQKAAHMAHWIGLVRDKYGGQIKLDRKKKAVVHYILHPYDLKHFKRATKEIICLLKESGALKIFHPHNQMNIYDQSEDFDAFVEAHDQLQWRPCTFNIGSAHQMGTCRMSGHKTKGVVKPNGQVWGVPNLYVADASLFPSASGVNPMLSVQALAYHVGMNMI